MIKVFVRIVIKDKRRIVAKSWKVEKQHGWLIFITFVRDELASLIRSQEMLLVCPPSLTSIAETGQEIDYNL